MAHTPGPWYWEKRGSRYRLYTPKNGSCSVMDFVRMGMQGAQPRFSDRGDQPLGGVMRTIEEIGNVLDNPDARLIAAAPDLLAALKLCLPLVQNDIYSDGSDYICYFCGEEIDSGDEHKDDCKQIMACRAARAAIAKAEGVKNGN